MSDQDYPPYGTPPERYTGIKEHDEQTRLNEEAARAEQERLAQESEAQQAEEAADKARLDHEEDDKSHHDEGGEGDVA